MEYHSFTLLFLFSLFRFTLSVSPAYINCQLQRPDGESPTLGCPEGTLYVSATDHLHANFSSIQDAIDSLPLTDSATILIGAGTYYEMLKVTRFAPLTLLGQLNAAALTGSAYHHNLVRIWNKRHREEGMSDDETATISITASSGESFGNSDFKVYNINFENRAAEYAISQALVVSVEWGNASFYGCTFGSYQDTFYAGDNANTFVSHSAIFGEVDYLFGCGTAVFQSVVLLNRGCGGGVSAWQGSPGTKKGVYVFDSNITRSPDANTTAVTDRSCFLARPWNIHATGVFLRNYMDESIQPSGYTSWSSGGVLPETTYYAEFGSSGPGGNLSARIPEAHILNHSEAAMFTLDYIFDGAPRWIDFDFRP